MTRPKPCLVGEMRDLSVFDLLDRFHNNRLVHVNKLADDGRQNPAVGKVVQTYDAGRQALQADVFNSAHIRRRQPFGGPSTSLVGGIQVSTALQ